MREEEINERIRKMNERADKNGVERLEIWKTLVIFAVCIALLTVGKKSLINFGITFNEKFDARLIWVFIIISIIFSGFEFMRTTWRVIGEVFNMGIRLGLTWIILQLKDTFFKYDFIDVKICSAILIIVLFVAISQVRYDLKLFFPVLAAYAYPWFIGFSREIEGNPVHTRVMFLIIVAVQIPNMIKNYFEWLKNLSPEEHARLARAGRMREEANQRERDRVIERQQERWHNEQKWH